MVRIINEGTNCSTDLVNRVISSINGEWKTIQEYNEMIVQFEGLGMLDAVRVIKDINEEEHKHVGQLTELIRAIAPDSINDIDDIYKGSVEGNEQLSEDTVKKSNGKWTNRGDDGTEHGEFNTKKEADAQRKAMFANGYKGK